MNQLLTEPGIRRTYRALAAVEGRVSGRRLCAELRKRFGAVGKTERVFAIWREEVAAAAAPPEPFVPADVKDLIRRVTIAEAPAAQNLARAERAELREQAHQEAWAAEIDRLRQALRRQGSPPTRVSTTKENVLVGPTARVHAHQYLKGEGQLVVEFSDLETKLLLLAALAAALPA